MAGKSRIPKRRVDALLVERGLADDLPKARALVMAGQVVVGERRVDKAGEQVPVETELRLKGRAAPAHPYVGRGGLKLAGGLDGFGVDPAGRVCVDLGASTGGFTDVLLRRGAARVYAVDVAYGALDYRLRQDPRVVVLERTDARDLDRARVPEPVTLLVADISFNSLARVLPPAVALLAPGADVVTLVKPQFEVAAAEVGPGGVVADPALHARVLAEASEAARGLGLSPIRTMPAPITGATGNQEHLLHCRLERSPAGA